VFSESHTGYPNNSEQCSKAAATAKILFITCLFCSISSVLGTISLNSAINVPLSNEHTNYLEIFFDLCV